MKAADRGSLALRLRAVWRRGMRRAASATAPARKSRARPRAPRPRRTALLERRQRSGLPRTGSAPTRKRAPDPTVRVVTTAPVAGALRFALLTQSTILGRQSATAAIIGQPSPFVRR